MNQARVTASSSYHKLITILVVISTFHSSSGGEGDREGLGHVGQDARLPLGIVGVARGHHGLKQDDED